MNQLIWATFAIAIPLAAQPNRPLPDPLLKKARIALRLDSGQILIVGGGIKGDNLISNSSSIQRFPKTVEYARLQPGESIYELPSGNMANFTFEPATPWHIGDRWKLYSGAGTPVTVTIRKLAVVLYCGGIGGYAAAIASFESPDAANLVASLQATEYLAAPGPGLAAVSTTPLMRQTAEPAAALTELLRQHGRAVVKDEEWMIPQANISKEFADRIRRMNRTFLTEVTVAPRIRYFRWRPPGRNPLLFVEALWVDGDGTLPLFACDAVIEEGSELKVLSLLPTQGEYMRIGEFEHHAWKLEETNAFLNAWKIGGRYFVLLYRSGYEASSVELMELVPGKGLVETGLGFGSGC